MLSTHHDMRVLITAAATGIGRVTAARFVAAGAKVFICDVDAAALSAAIGAQWGQNPSPKGSDPIGLTGIVADVSDEAQVTALFGHALAHLGGLDVMVNMAGIAGPTANLEDIELSDWRQCLAINLDGAFICAKAAIPHLKRSRSGSIVLLSSNAGLFGFPRRSPYAAAKWAIRGLTRTLAQELGPSGIRVNCICPGAVEGDRIDRVIAAEARKTNRSHDQVRAQYVSRSSLRQMVKPEDIAEMILFLTSEAGARISGQEIAIDGHTETL